MQNQETRELTINELIDIIVREDDDFTDAKFKTKVDNMYIQIFTAIMKQDLMRIKHFVSEELFEKLENKVKKLQEANLIQIYGELNVTNTKILKIIEYEDKFEIQVDLYTKYLDYKIDKNTKKLVSGDCETRVEEHKKITLTKIKNAKDLGVARKCDSCGANIDINFNGKCQFCGSIFNLQKYDWIIRDIS